jgi:hypothetical protein
MIKVEPVQGGGTVVEGRRGSHERGWERLRSHGTDNESNRVETDPMTGLAVSRPYNYSGQRGKRMIAAAGSGTVLGGRIASTPDEGMPGARRLGTGYQLPGVKPPRIYDEERRIVGIEYNGNPNPSRRDDTGTTEGGDDSRDESGRDEGGES